MITVGMNYEVLKGKEKIFENAFEGVLKLMKTLAGHKDSKLYQDVHHAGHYLIISEWDSESTFQSFIGSEQFAKVVDWGKGQILSARPRHRIFQS